MNVTRHKVVSFDYTLSNDAGDVLDSSEGGNPLTYLHGVGNIVPGLESALESKAAGDTFTVAVPPEQGYGPRAENQIAKIPRANLQGAGEVQPGMPLHAESPSGPITVYVVAVDEETITVDGNHPLAGETLHFDIKVVDIREATPEEIQHQHAHGPGGHHH